jgi:hypothetical protein
MASLTAYAQNLVVDALIRGQPIVPPLVWYVALVTTMGSTNYLAGVEVLGGSYSRVAVGATLAAWAGTQGEGSTGVSIGTSGMTSNNNAIAYPLPTANWGTVVGYEFWDAPINGNRWLFDRLGVPKTVSIGDPAVVFPPGELHVSFV